MLHDQKLLKFIWGETTNFVVTIQNRVPHQALDSKTPEEVSTGVNLNVGHLYIFGCPIYFHMLRDKRNNLESSGIKGTFVGYYENYKAFRIYIPGQRKVEIRRDVLTVLEPLTFQGGLPDNKSQLDLRLFGGSPNNGW